MSNPLKQIRGQIRQIALEVLPQVVAAEAVVALEKRIMEYVKKRLDAIDERTKDIQGYMVRQSARVPAPSTENPLKIKT